MSRPFNQKAYDAFDLKNKEALVELMKEKDYTLVGDINEEHYKKYDVKFSKGNDEISFENETRVNFNSIRDFFNTIHIPARKKNTEANYYVVWKPDMNEFFLIPNNVIKDCAKDLIEIVCNEFDEDKKYLDSFIDIPKERATHFTKINGKWKNK